MKKGILTRYFIVLLTVPFLLQSCEKEISLDLPKPEKKLVVEGHIELQQYPYLILTKNTSFFDADDFTGYEDLFVHDAVVTVNNGTKQVTLQEICLENIPAHLKPLVAQFLGYSPDDLISDANICVYVSFDMLGEVGKKYNLNIMTSEDTVSANTSIPGLPVIDSLWVVPHDELNGYYQMMASIVEPDTQGNYYRYFTSVNNEPFFPGYFGSVISDDFFNGETFTLEFDRGYASNSNINFEYYGLVQSGDTVSLKVSSMDHAHFRFWETFENQALGGGPLSSPTYIQSNINGGLGVWGGYGPIIETIVVP